MIVVCLEGCHGSGKTTLTEEFRQAGYPTLDEAFIGMPTFANIHPQTLLMESCWVSHWFTRLLTYFNENVGERGDHTNQIFIADRSPYSAVFYARERGELLDPLITANIEELRRYGIFVITVYIDVDRSILWSRIQDRLLKEPDRKRFNEGSREWMEKTVKFYESRKWDVVIKNNTVTVAQLMRRLLDDVSECEASPVRIKTLATVSPTRV